VIVLDTHVVSEPLRPAPDAQVVAWLDAQHVETLYLTAVTLAELRYGVAVLPDGRRKRAIDERLERELIPLFDGRVLAFDDAAGRSYALLQATARATGRAMSVMDGLIAACCAANDFVLATRNVSHFAATSLDLIDPWEP